MMNPLKPGRALLGPVLAVVMFAWLLRWAYEQIRPVLPLLTAAVVLAVLVRLWLWWRRRW